MKNMTFTGMITATSKKLDNDFKQLNPTKTAYIDVDEATAKKLEAFGLTRYTSVEDRKDFFVVKLSSNLVYYQDNTNKSVSIADLAGVDTPNFNSGDEPIMMNLIQGENKGNKFFRIQSLLLPHGEEQLNTVVAENPFA